MSDLVMGTLEGFPSSREKAMINKLLIVEVPVSSMKRAIEFYAGQLGFFIDLKKNPPSIWEDSREVFMYPAEGIKIMLWQTEGTERLGFTRDGKPHHFLILEIVESAEVVRNKLMENGVKVGEISGEIADMGGCGRAFDVWDPDGNILRLCYRPS
ncbi:VOC family protein [Paenibacillus spongiae]|uniref:VOC family protein n=1 Tax=Paenibacillus spongiae TaxID=2909671 RepID=A0ABY5SL07_9BACL|nr:VOC family protein [Paenibacillus spongiae]UVI33243.1 VOC family protein [Paenibacillus spongiae]